MAVLTGIELCAGVGMLGEGIRAAFRFLGHDYRAVAYVEREAFAAAQLVALMESECLDAAPVWSDMLTFDSGEFRGKVDCVIAGFPCQDLSIAGRRAGLDGKRSGLFFRVCDIADDCQAQILILENVSAIASATASVVDEAEGELEERAAARVMGELADRGWDSEWITLSASEVGASHRRARWFCFAWRMADAECAERRAQRTAGSRGGKGHDGSGREANRRPRVAIETLGNAGLQHEQLQQRAHGAEHSRANSQLDDTDRIGAQRPGGAQQGSTAGCAAVGEPESIRWRERRPESTGQQGRSDVAEHGGAVANAENTNGRRQQQPEISWRGRCRPSGIGASVANTISPRLQERTGGGSNDEPLQPTERSDPISVCGALGIFAPGPNSTEWPGILERFPFLAPATEPGVRGVVDGGPLVVDESRTHQLRAIGNGVVPAQAGCALVTLVRRSGITLD